MRLLPFNNLFQCCLLALSFLLIGSCATNPVTGKRQVSLISEQQEIQMGQSYDPQVVAEMGIYESPSLQQFLTQQGNAMAATSHRPNLPWTFRLVDTDVVNAFAVPGGFVYFTRGIMAHFNNEAQFAGVLGHEIGHVTARHTVQQQSKQTLLGGVAMAGMILSPELASQGESLMQGMQLLFLKYGRDAEEQSDKLGVEYSTEIGYDAREMAGFFSTLDRLSGGSENRVPTFLSTHPDPLNREARVGQLAAEYQAADQQKTYDVGRESYLRRIDGMIYGEDPKQGYVEAGSFYHPELRFQFRIPNNWTLINTPSQVQIVSPDQKSLIQMQLAQGSDPQAAGRSFAEQANMQVSDQSTNSINGLPAYTLVGTVTQPAQQQGQQGQSLGVEASFISYGGNVYAIMGLSAVNDFRRYQRDIQVTTRSFAELTDQSKINRQPERLKIVTNNRQQTLQQALLGAGIPQNRVLEFAILNGMEVNESMPAGMLFKAVSGGNISR